MKEIYKFKSLDEISFEAIKILKKRLEDSEELAVAFSGGKTPKRFYELLRKENLDWEKLHVFLVDDRQVDPDNEDSNINLLNNTFIKYISIPEKNIHFPKYNIDIEKRAKNYGEIIKKYFEKSGKKSFDLAYLGMGTDGHTASLFNMKQVDLKGISLSIPEDKNLNIKRISLSKDVLMEIKELVYLISGENKKEIFKEAIIKKGEYPANKIRNNNTKYFIDFLE